MQAETTFAGRQILGERENQEDCYGFCPLGGEPPGLLLALADGMGGHEGGEIASEAAVHEFIRTVDLRQPNRRRALYDAVLSANQRIKGINKRLDRQAMDMGTTFVGVLLTGAQLHFVSVGDSLLFIFRDGQLVRLNQEHATTDEHGKPMLTSALTGEEVALINAPEASVLLLPGDVVLCASDGALSLDLPRLAGKLQVHHNQTAGEIAEILVEAVGAERKKRQDNVTVCVIKA